MPIIDVTDNLYAFPWLDPASNNCNTYLLSGQKNIMVDPGHFHLFGRITELLSTISLTLDDIDLILLTHGHPDHTEAIGHFRDHHALIGFPRIEMDFIREAASRYGDMPGLSDIKPSILLEEGDLTVGDMNLKVIHAPGHSPGSMCFYWPDKGVLLSGDVLFAQGLGRTDLPGGSGEQLKQSIRHLSRLDVAFLLPGHGEMVTGETTVEKNFSDIERTWFAYI